MIQLFSLAIGYPLILRGGFPLGNLLDIDH